MAKVTQVYAWHLISSIINEVSRKFKRKSLISMKTVEENVFREYKVITTVYFCPFSKV